MKINRLYHGNTYCIKIIKIIHLALDLKINQFELDMNDVNDLNINNYYFNEFRLRNYFDLNENNKSVILNNDEYSDEYRFGAFR